MLDIHYTTRYLYDDQAVIFRTYTFTLITLIVTRNAIEMTETIRAQMFVSTMCRKTSTIVRGTAKYPSGRLIASPSSNGICVFHSNRMTNSPTSRLVTLTQKTANKYIFDSEQGNVLNFCLASCVRLKLFSVIKRKNL